MKVRYDDEVDAAYIQLSSKRPKGAIEVREGASHRFPIRSLHTLQFVHG